MKKSYEEIIVHQKKNSKKVKAGIKKSELKNIEVETVEYVLEDEKCSKALLTHSIVSPSLATEVIYPKYYIGVHVGYGFWGT